MTSSEKPVKERRILFSGPMVRAILDGRKTQTRRAIHPDIGNWLEEVSPGDWRYIVDIPEGSMPAIEACPYGQPGDRLWVRETFAVQPELWAAGHGPQPIHYLADTPRDQIEDYVVKPSIHMPRWASRITLEITDVRVERVQEIAIDDIYAEGCPPISCGDEDASELYEWFSGLWDDINAKRGYGWDANPRVWVIDVLIREIEAAHDVRD